MPNFQQTNRQIQWMQQYVDAIYDRLTKAGMTPQDAQWMAGRARGLATFGEAPGNRASEFHAMTARFGMSQPQSEALLSMMKALRAGDDTVRGNAYLEARRSLGALGFGEDDLNKLESGGSLDDFINKYGFALPESSAPPPSPYTGGTANTADRDALMRDLQAEYTRLSGAPSGDPVFQSLINAGRSAGQYAAGRAGVASNEGLGLRGVAAAATQATTPYLQSRQQLAQGYMGLANQRDLGLGNLALGRDQLTLQGQQMQDQFGLQAQAMQNQIALANWQQQQTQAQGLGALLGAGVGALGFLGGPALGAATMPLGASLGGGLGGMIGGGAAPSLGSYTPRGNYNVPGGGYRGGWS